jgi:hypothetical protein
MPDQDQSDADRKIAEHLARLTEAQKAEYHQQTALWHDNGIPLDHETQLHLINIVAKDIPRADRINELRDLRLRDEWQQQDARIRESARQHPPQEGQALRHAEAPRRQTPPQYGDMAIQNAEAIERFTRNSAELEARRQQQLNASTSDLQQVLPATQQPTSPQTVPPPRRDPGPREYEELNYVPMQTANKEIAGQKAAPHARQGSEPQQQHQFPGRYGSLNELHDLARTQDQQQKDADRHDMLRERGRDAPAEKAQEVKAEKTLEQKRAEYLGRYEVKPDELQQLGQQHSQTQTRGGRTR